MMTKYFLLAACCIVFTTLSFSQTHLPAIFSDNMVLQQQQQVSVWGTDKPYGKIVVTGSWGKNARAVADDRGYWKLKINTPSAGGPYTINIKGSSTVVLKNVLIGEVWLCSGQSNMEMPVKGNFNQPVLGSNEAILNSLNDKIRMFTQRKTSSLTPSYDMNGVWNAASPATTGGFSAAAYFFAKKLQALLGVPVGLVHTSWGASTIESWMDKETLAGFKHIQIPDTLPKTDVNKTPTMMYNSMLHQYIGYTIKGAIWYQGEANRTNAAEYQAMFTGMIASWRRQWQQGDFPFYFVQIAPFGYKDTGAAFVREAQMKTMQTVKNTGMAVTLDIGDQVVIHPAQKEAVGNRLAYWALVKDYDIEGIACSGPVYRDMQQTNNGRIKLTFDYSESGLTSFGKPLTDFEIAGDDKVFYPAFATINNNDKGANITVWSDSVKKPVSVRYAFKSWVVGSLFNTQGLPASSFRTDNW
ncbi:sialate O-acetylesterase family protein [Ferruginibacter profundus]